MRRMGRMVTVSLFVVVCSLLLTPPAVLAQVDFDVELSDFAAQVVDTTTVVFEVTIEAIGDEGSPPGEVVARWEGEEVGRWPLKAREYAAGSFTFEGVISLPEEWAGRTGWLEVDVSIPGDWDPDNNLVGQLVDLPGVTVEPGDMFEVDQSQEPEATPEPTVDVPPETGVAPGPSPPSRDNGIDPTWVLLGAGGMLVVAEAVRRRRSRHRRQAEAIPRRLEGPCRPGMVRTTRSCRPQPKLRKVTGIRVTATERSGKRRPIDVALDRSEARNALAVSLRHRQQGHSRRLTRKLDETASQLAGELVGLLPAGGAGWDVTLAGGYEGSKMKCTFQQRKCGRDGAWPGKLLQEWTGTATDQGTVGIGKVSVVDRQPSDELATALRPLLAAFLERVCETSHFAPAGIGISVEG